jgi:hypothetical protein
MSSSSLETSDQGWPIVALYPCLGIALNNIMWVNPQEGGRNASGRLKLPLFRALNIPQADIIKAACERPGCACLGEPHLAPIWLPPDAHPGLRALYSDVTQDMQPLDDRHMVHLEQLILGRPHLVAGISLGSQQSLSQSGAEMVFPAGTPLYEVGVLSGYGMKRCKP